MDVVSDLIRSGLTVEQSILVNELVIVGGNIQAKASFEAGYMKGHDAAEAERRAYDRDRMRSARSERSEQTPSPSPPMINNSSTPLSSSSNPVSENPLFEEFWRVFPRKVGKGAARKCWRNALKRATAEEIIAGAKRYAALKLDLEFTKHPGPWLNADRWLDEGPKAPEVGIFPKRTWAEQRAEREGGE
jgi:hypothetical protein